MQLKTEKSFRDFLKTLSDDTIIKYYLDIEWSPFPILVIKEYQKRFKSKTKNQILRSLRLQANVAKKKSKEMKKIARKRGVKIIEIGRNKAEDIKKTAKKKGFDIDEITTLNPGKQIQKTKRQIQKTIKNTTTSKKRRLELLEKLGALRESGIITQKEFQHKKKKILAQI